MSRPSPLRAVVDMARHHDLACLVLMQEAAVDAERAFSPDLVPRRIDPLASRRSFKATLLRGQRERTFVARVGRQVIGMLCVELHRARSRHSVVRRHGFMHSLYVAPAHRRQRVAARLVARGLVWSRRQGALQVRLEMAAGNTGARRLYGRLGFLPREVLFTLDLRRPA
jgi:ribosomal protein S18 acetylase RimI-like enzyme